MENQINEEINKEKKSKKKKYLLLLLLLLLVFKIIFWYNYFQKPDDIQGVKGDGNNTVDTNTVIDEPINNTVSDKDNNVGATNNNYHSEIDNKDDEEPTENPEQTEQPEDIEIKEFKVTSNGQKITDDLTIFDDVMYDGKPVIYPSIQNTYYFEINNTLDFNTICEVSFNEKNEENIPIKYRLKENGKYIRGDANTYISYDQLNFTNVVNSNSENKYELEWKWIEGSNDNYYGDVNKTITYQIELTVKATGETEE